MQPPSGSAVALARRLRDLRRNHWPDRRLTQRELGEALGYRGHPLSESLISSWESTKEPVTPPDHRLRAYATFFATQRSVQGSPPRVLPDDQLTDDERTRRDELHQELLRLRGDDVTAAHAVRIPLAGPGDSIGGGMWFFEDQKPVTIICARLPRPLLERMPYTDPADPDYVRLYTYADLDSLVELHGHVRAVNPASYVTFKTADDLVSDDLTAHLVLLGGVDWNPVTMDLTGRLALPVRQRSRAEAHFYDGFFEVNDGGKRREIRPVLDEIGSTVTLREDVGHFFRGLNPFNERRTVTICNGTFGRGTYGVVRALTDARFRDRNEQYLTQRFGGRSPFSIVTRVLVVKGETVTPDWTRAENRLHEWPEKAG